MHSSSPYAMCGEEWQPCAVTDTSMRKHKDSVPARLWRHLCDYLHGNTVKYKRLGPGRTSNIQSFPTPSGTKTRTDSKTAAYDGLRGLACLVVFNFHFLYPYTKTITHGYAVDTEDVNWRYPHQLPFLCLLVRGRAMVTLFFAISGYVLSYNFLASARGDLSLHGITRLASLTLRRWMRLFIPASFSMLLVCFATYLGAFDKGRQLAGTGLVTGAWEEHPPRFDTFAEQWEDFRKMWWSWSNLWEWRFYYGNYDPHTWTIPVELRGSMVLFMILLASLGLKQRWRFGLIALVMSYCFCTGKWHLATFIAGALIADFHLTWPRSDRTPSADPVDDEKDFDHPSKFPTFEVAQRRQRYLVTRRYSAVLSKWFVFLLGLYILSFPDDKAEVTPGFVVLRRWTPPMYNYPHHFWHSFASIFIIWSVTTIPTVREILNWPFPQYLGKTSYGFYLVHGPLLHSLGFALQPKIFAALGHETVTRWCFGLLVGWVIMLGVSIGVAHLFWKFVDVPLVKLTKRIEKVASRERGDRGGVALAGRNNTNMASRNNKKDMLTYGATVETVVSLQRDLARKYRNVGPQVNDIWRGFTPKQRETAMKEATGDGMVLKHSRDPSMGDLFHFISEYNLRDMTADPEHFLDMLRFCAETDLTDQVGMRDGPYIMWSMETHRFRGRPGDDGRDDFMIFLSGENYGKPMRSTDPNANFLQENPVLANSGICFPAATGQLILLRQNLFFQYFNHLIEEVLELGSSTRIREPPSKTRSTTSTLTNAMSVMRLQPPPLKLTLSDVLVQALEQKLSLEEYLDVLRTEPQVLNSAVQSMYYSRPELVPDEKGRILPALTDEYISMALFDTVTGAVQAIAYWQYIFRLLQKLDDLDDKFKRPFILDELANACHLEYRRAQKAFRRQMSSPSAFTVKRFRHISTTQDLGVPKIAIKGRPSDYTVSDPQVHYILQLCHPDTTPKQAVEWIQKLDAHNAKFAGDHARLLEDEMTALGGLAVIVSFIQAMSTTISLNPSGKQAQRFVSRSAKLVEELNRLKSQADFGDHVIPMYNILEPGVATAALQALNDFVVHTTGEKLGLLYHDLSEDSLADLEESYLQAKAKAVAAEQATTYVPFPTLSQSTGAGIIHPTTNIKAKTRGTPRELDITAPPKEPPTPATPPPKLRVKASTAAVFNTIFSTSEAKGFVAWSDFEAALADLAFSVTPRAGSIFTFIPPGAIGSGRPINFHRPHKSGRAVIEGHILPIFKHRLNSRYGWTSDTFEIV
ncbi:O-acetyltransferase PaAT-1 [Fulvia fulva]|nr:O-acetyltransferase PaAT-1 [Fulvia fulva]WPV14914.1 O-acetyltransferase PaAT-1 [Fulvia fulva]